MNPYQFYHDLIAISQTGPTPYESCFGRWLDTDKFHSIKLKSAAFPWSLKPSEFAYLGEFIRKHNLKTGYEIATGFGVSSLAIALGMLDTGGKLVTMDAYIEEAENSAEGYEQKHATYKDANGYKSVCFLRDYFKLENVLCPVVGFSPDDTSEAIKGVHGDNELSFVFIDGLHSENAITADTLSIIPFLAEKFVIFYHDGGFSEQFAKQLEGIVTFKHKYNVSNDPSALLNTRYEYRLIDSCREPYGYNLGMISNLE